jgi:hypothetical protein
MADDESGIGRVVRLAPFCSSLEDNLCFLHRFFDGAPNPG